MRKDTKDIHDLLKKMGSRLGLDSATEVSFELGAESQAYAPRLDALWSLRLTSAQVDALNAIGAHPPLHRGMLPIAAWEVEGSDASTKGMQADLANMRVFGAYLSFLAVRGDTDLFDWAVRLTTTQSHYFGHRRSHAVDLDWIPELADLKLSSSLPALPPPTISQGSGGTSDWAKGQVEDSEQARRGGGVQGDPRVSGAKGGQIRPHRQQDRSGMGSTTP